MLGHMRNRKRILWVAKILWEETDESSPIFISELVECLERIGVPAKDEAVYKDIKAINGTLFPVKFKRKHGWYSVKEGENHADRA